MEQLHFDNLHRASSCYDCPDWCFDPAMDHHQGDGNSLLHQVASCYIPATLNCSSFEGRGGLISQSRVGLNCHSRNEVKTPAAVGGSDSAIWPAISINNHADYGKTDQSCSSHS
jgi:hypothetical protein